MKQPLWTADLYGDIWWPNYIGIRKWKIKRARAVLCSQCTFLANRAQITSRDGLGLVRFASEGSEIVVFTYGPKITRTTLRPLKKKQVWKYPLPAICVITCVPICGCNSCSERLWLNKWVKPTTDTVHTQENYIQVNVVNGDVLS